jgi:hypothetical protein
MDPQVRRKDGCGAWIDWAAYGMCIENGTGWEIDHAVPVAVGGGDEITNLQPLQWQNNRHKGDDWPTWSCLVCAVRTQLGPPTSTRLAPRLY